MRDKASKLNEVGRIPQKSTVVQTFINAHAKEVGKENSSSQRWCRRQFGQIATIREGQVSPLEEPYRSQYHIGPDNIAAGGGLTKTLSTCQELGLTSGKYKFTPGAILYSKIRPNLNKVCKVDFDGACSADIYPLYVIPGEVIADYLVHAMRATAFVRQAVATSTRSGMPKINRVDLNHLELILPPLPEQRKIADILNTWDEALGKLDALIAAKERCKQALLQQLLTGQNRVKGFSDKWRAQDLGSAVTPISRPVSKPGELFLAAGIRSHGKGIFLKPDFKPSEIALDELFQLRTDDLVVNITFAWEGALAIVPPEANGALVSHRFPTFRCESGKTAIGFIRHLIRTKHFIYLCGLSTPGGAGRNRVLSKTSFLKIAVRMPSIQEQTAIAAILDTCDEELRLLGAQRIALDQSKRGLMQRLLTGAIRVRLEKT